MCQIIQSMPRAVTYQNVGPGKPTNMTFCRHLTSSKHGRDPRVTYAGWKKMYRKYNFIRKTWRTMDRKLYFCFEKINNSFVAQTSPHLWPNAYIKLKFYDLKSHKMADIYIFCNFPSSTYFIREALNLTIDRVFFNLTFDWWGMFLFTLFLLLKAI